MPADRVAALRKAFTDMLDDPAFRAEAAERRMVVNPVAAEKIEAVIKRAMATPETLLAAFREMVKINPPGKK